MTKRPEALEPEVGEAPPTSGGGLRHGSPLSEEERRALVERMLPAYRVLLRSGDQIPVQDKGDTVHGQVS
jgi:hypothetical protein